MVFAGVAATVLFVVQIAILVTALYGFGHAAMQRSDAFTAADKLTKPVWLLILGVGAVLAALPNFILGWAIAAGAIGIYLVDVRPKLLEIQGKSR